MNFFVTGDGSVKANIDLKLVTPAESHGANFAADGQNLRQSLSIAREVFSRVEHGKIDFVLIGLAPDVLFQGGSVDENLDALTEYLKLCVSNGSKLVCVILPVAPNVRDRYRQKFVTPLRDILTVLKDLINFELVDLFDLSLPENHFVDEILTSSGGRAVNTILGFELYKRGILPFADLQRVSYRFFYDLSFCSPSEFFHGIMSNIFSTTVAELKRKARIKVAFVTDNASVWCSDELYNMFANNPRFEPTIFLCLPNTDKTNDLTITETVGGVEKFKSRGLNVVGIFDEDAATEPQDVIISLRPYDEFLPKTLRSVTMTPQTLLTYIHYCYETTTAPVYHNYPIFRLAWKFFVDSELTRKLFDKCCAVGMPRAYASGMPKTDIFFDATKQFSFPWKMIRPDATKIVWTPHWTISNDDGPTTYGTFQRNYKFMYEFAKNHPETSWVVKPHPLLANQALNGGLFASDEDFKAYVRAWNDLPNASFVTGAYYQDIFATSDGMINDSNSFIAEYQFTHKPMIYLTRDNPPEFTELGETLLDVTYRVDGRDFDGIAALIRKVFVDGDDPLKNARQKLFDEQLNYVKRNTMTASEFIFRNIADELEV